MAKPAIMERNLALEAVRVTEAAAIAASRWMGRGDKEGADGAAVDAMRVVLSSVSMDGIVVIGEGEKDEAPMLFNGEEIGDGSPPRVDIAVDPLEGTTLTFNTTGGGGGDVEPNQAHRTIAELEKLGKLDCIITQNVDGLHQKAGSSEERVLELQDSKRRIAEAIVRADSSLIRNLSREDLVRLLS